MRMYLISDNVDTHTGMRLSGVDGQVVHTDYELTEALSLVLSKSDIGILLITEKIKADFPEQIEGFRAEHKTPLLVEIPDRHGSIKGDNFLSAYTGESLGK